MTSHPSCPQTYKFEAPPRASLSSLRGRRVTTTTSTTYTTIRNRRKQNKKKANDSKKLPTKSRQMTDRQHCKKINRTAKRHSVDGPTAKTTVWQVRARRSTDERREERRTTSHKAQCRGRVMERRVSPAKYWIGTTENEFRDLYLYRKTRKPAGSNCPIKIKSKKTRVCDNNIALTIYIYFYQNMF